MAYTTGKCRSTIPVTCPGGRSMNHVLGDPKTLRKIAGLCRKINFSLDRKLDSRSVADILSFFDIEIPRFTDEEIEELETIAASIEIISIN